MAFKARSDSVFISSIVSKRCPRSGLLSLGKSHGAKSGEYGDREYELNFWRNGLEESMQCEMVHYRGTKIKNCLPIILASFCE